MCWVTYKTLHIMPNFMALFILLKNEPRNAKNDRLIKWSIVCIFDEA